MGRIQAEVTEVIDARPADVYAVLADYRHGHPNILPREYVVGLEVEQGGHGAGTVAHVRMRVFGVERVYHMVVGEPDPGRILAETDTDSGVETTFTVTPVADGERTEVRIATDWAAKGGLLGALERLGNPPVARRIYRKELRQLAA